MSRNVRLVAILAAVGLWWAPASAQEKAKPTDAARTALQAAGPSAALAICPVQVMGGQQQKVAEVLGLVLEQRGMSNLEIAPPFMPPADTAWADIPARLAEFARQSAPSAAYVLFAEYVGTPQTGPQEVRFIVVDKQGTLVLNDRQTSKDADFKKTAGADPDPMGCSVLVAERLFKCLHWKEGKPVKDGKFAQLWSKASGLPDDAEQAAIERRLAKLKQELATAQIVVLPPLVNEEPDAAQAGAFATALAEALHAQVRATTTPAPLKLAPGSNELKRLWDLARGLREYLRANKVDGDYVVLAEYMLNPEKKAVHAVHVVICDRAGDWVMTDLENDQHEDFKRIAPKSVADCTRLAVERCKARVK
jgi:hypothetical protein